MNRPNSLRELLQLSQEQVAQSELAGDTWTLGAVYGALDGAQDLFTAHTASDLLAKIEALAGRFPYDWQAVREQRPEAKTIVEEMARDDPDAAPSRFIPHVLRVALLHRQPQIATDDELGKLTAYNAALLAAMTRHLSFLPTAAHIIAETAHVMLQCSMTSAQPLTNTALQLVDSFESQGHVPPEVLRARVPLLEALYEVEQFGRDADPPIDPGQRLAAAKNVLGFLHGRLEPAIQAREHLWQDNERMFPEVERARLALRHRVLTWEASETLARDELPADRSVEWLRLAAGYASLGDANNRANALSVLVDEFLTILDKRPDQLEALRASMRRATAELASALADVDFPARSERRALLRRLAMAHCALGEHADAERYVREALDGLRADVDEAEDVYRLGRVMLGADDLLGVALLFPFPPADIFTEAFNTIRRFDLPSLSAPANGHAIRVHATRVASAIGVASAAGNVHWQRGSDSHELARTLAAFRARSDQDYAEWSKTKKVPQSQAGWNALLPRLRSQLGLGALEASVLEAKRIVLELDGVALHLPVAGLILELAPTVDAIIASHLLPTAVPCPPVPTDVDAVLALNCFSKTDSLHQTFRSIALTTGAKGSDYVTCVRPEDVRKALQRPSKLILIGAHGLQSDVTGELTVTVGSASLPIDELLSSATLPRASTVFCLTCFAGSGFLSSAGRWASLPGSLIAAGARTVVANRWPAWIEPQTYDELKKLILELRAASTRPDAWPAAEAVTTYVRATRSKHNDARQWAGWAAWSSSSSWGQ